MAKLPGPDSLGERPTPRPATGVAQYRADFGALEEPGKALFRAGAETLHEADRLYAQAKVEEERADNVRVQDALNQLKAKALDLEIGEQEGYKRLKGGQVANRPIFSEYTKKYEDAVAGIASTLSSDRQREKFALSQAPVGMQVKEGLLRHMAAQSDVYAKETHDGTVKLSQREAVANWDNPLVVATAIVAIERSVNDMAERFGYSPEQKSAELQQEVSKVHSAVVQQAIATGATAYAQKWFEEHRKDIDLPTAKALEVVVRDGEQKQLANGYRAEFLAGRGNLKAQAALMEKVMKDPSLGEDRRNVLVGQIQNETMRIQAKQEAAQARWERKAERAIDSFNANTLAGFPGTDPKTGLQMVDAFKGTAMEGPARAAVALADATRQFSILPPVVQARQLAEVEAAVRKDPNKFDRKIIDAWKSIHENQRREAESNPTGLLARQGLVDLQPLDIAKPDATAPALAQRFAVAREASARFSVPVKPLQPEEVQALGAALREMPPERQAVYFGQLKNAAGGDNQGFMAVMGQLAPDNPVAAVAGSHAGMDRWQPAALILRGNAALHPNKKTDGQPGKSLVTMPPDIELERTFKDAVGDAFAGKPEQRSAMFQAVKAAYAGLAVDSPKDADPKSVNSAFFEKAMKTVIGEVQPYKGRSVVLPYGYDAAMFKDGVARLLDQQLDQGLKTEFSRDRLLDLPLVNKGDGRYVLMSGDSRVLDKDGREIVVDFTRGLPFRFSGSAPAPKAPERRDITDLARRTKTER